MKFQKINLVAVSSFIGILILIAGTQGCGDLLHAHCQLYWTFPDVQCATLLPIFVNQFKDCCMEKTILPQYTNYTLVNYSSDPSDLWVNGKLRFTDHYVDDQNIVFSQNGTACSASACSHSESLSYYDYDANFCDVHNLARGIGYSFSENITNCRFQPPVGQHDSYCNQQK